MKYYYLITLIALVFVGCKDSINDQSKRNADNCWWVDAKTGKGKWIPIGDQNAVKNGHYTLFYANGNVFERGRLVDGKYADTTFNYDSKGRLLCYSFENADSIAYYFPKNGQVTLNYHQGGIHVTGVVENHSFGDKFKEYYRNGNVHWIRNYSKGIGWLTYYYENGNVQDSDYCDGKVSINVKNWFEDGHIKVVNEIKFEGDYPSISKEYYENGQLKALTHDKHQKIEGLGLAWYEDGKLQAKVNYKNGERDGPVTLYQENGKVKMEGFFKDGQPDGEVKVYNEDGTLYGIKTFKDGQEISRQKF